LVSSLRSPNLPAIGFPTNFSEVNPFLFQDCSSAKSFSGHGLALRAKNLAMMTRGERKSSGRIEKNSFNAKVKDESARCPKRERRAMQFTLFQAEFSWPSNC
jgi:hypothetical protein